MENFTRYFEELYYNFNERKIDLVVEKMLPDVKWANGMDGGYVYGHDDVKKYWARQFGIVSSKVQPTDIQNKDGKVTIKVHQVVHDLEGNLLSDEIVAHTFLISGDKIAEFHLDKNS